MRVGFYSWSILFLFVAAWEIFCRTSGISALIIPTPSAVLQTLWEGLTIGYLWPHMWVTTIEIVLGLAVGCVIGFLSGIVLGEIEFVRRLLYPYVLASQVIPKLALGPLFVIWFGSGVLPTVIITALICFFPLLENSITGIQHVDPQKRDLFRMMGATRLQTLIRLKIPSGLPVILAGVRVAVVLSFVGAIVGEFIGANEGLGAMIIGAQGMMDTTLMFAVFVLITLLGMIFYQTTIIGERWLLSRHTKGEKT